MGKRTHRWLVAAALASVLLFACASLGASARAAGKPPLTTARFRVAAGAICAATTRRVDAMPEPPQGTGDPNDLAAISPYLAKLLQIVSSGLTKLKQLDPPRALAPLVRVALAQGDHQVALLTELNERAKAHKLTFAGVMGFFVSTMHDPDGSSAWKKLGVHACAGG